jgi:hypothetical protein
MAVESNRLHLVNIATAGALGDAISQPENRAILSVGHGVGPPQTTIYKPIFLGIPTFGRLSVPIAPKVPSTFIGILGHNVGCIPGPVVVGNARIDTGLSHTDLVLVVGTKPTRTCGQDTNK